MRSYAERMAQAFHTLPRPVFRFAPSPNGRLHLGHAFSALLNEALACQMQGRFLVRLEDIDVTRCTAELAKRALDDLAWLGLEWEEPVRVQSQHWQDYTRAADELKSKGLLYPCFCSRSEVASSRIGQDPDGAPLYGGTCRALDAATLRSRIDSGAPHAWRLNMEKALHSSPASFGYSRLQLPSGEIEAATAHPERWGDAIILRKEIPTSYHLSVVVDDALQGVTHIVRGADLEAATDLHVLLQILLGLPTPIYHHHSLLTDDAGEKLSKSRFSETLTELRDKGITAQDIRRQLEKHLPREA